MSIVDDSARNFEKVACGFAYEKREPGNYLSINAVLAKQSEGKLLRDMVRLQQIVKNEIAKLPIEILVSPDIGKGLYIYPEDSLHCTLFFDPAVNKRTPPQELNRLAASHPWQFIDAHGLACLDSYPRWFYAHPTSNPAPTVTFSLQLFFQADKFSRIYDVFLRPLKCDENTPSKVRKSASDKWVRGTINIARLLSEEYELVPQDQNRVLVELYRSLNIIADDYSKYQLDTLSLVESNAWLSSPSRIVRSYSLGQ